MKTQEAFERQLNQQLSSDKFPLIDITDRVMDRIRQHGNVRRQPVKKMVWMAGAAAVFLVLCGFGYAAVTWQLQRGDGSVSMEYSSYKPGDEWPHFDLSPWMNQLEPGEAALFYFKREGKDYFVSQENPVKYTSLAELETESGFTVPVPDSLAGGYTFQQGSISHDLEKPDPSLMESLRAESEHSGGDFAMRKIHVKEEKLGVSFVYRHEKGGEILILASMGEMWRKMYDNLEQKQVEKVSVLGHEALAVEDQTTGERKVFWLDERGAVPIYYKISTLTPDLVSMQALLKAAESLR